MCLCLHVTRSINANCSPYTEGGDALNRLWRFNNTIKLSDCNNSYSRILTGAWEAPPEDTQLELSTYNTKVRACGGAGLPASWKEVKPAAEPAMLMRALQPQ